MFFDDFDVTGSPSDASTEDQVIDTETFPMMHDIDQDLEMGNVDTKHSNWIKRSASQDSSFSERSPLSTVPSGSRATSPPRTSGVSSVVATNSDITVPEASRQRFDEELGLREHLVLYNWQRQTMARLHGDRISGAHLSIKQPLAQIMCRASSVLIRDNEVFASIALSTSYAVQVYDLEGGHLIRTVDTDVLPRSGRILLSSHNSRIYIAAFGRKTVYLINSDYKPIRVCAVKNPIGKLWVEIHDGHSLLCVYTHAETQRPFMYLRTRDRIFHYDLKQADILDCTPFGCYKGKCYLLSPDLRGVVSVHQKDDMCEFKLAQKIHFPYSYESCGDSIYVLNGDGIVVLNTETRRCCLIDASPLAGMVDEECRLIRRLTTASRT